MKNNWNKILNELSYRVSTGIPDLTNEQHLIKLWDILKEHKWPVDARVELLKNLDEARMVRNPNPSPNKKKDMVTIGYARTFFKDQGVDADDLSDDEIDSMAQSSIASGNVRGNPNEGDNKVKNEMLEHGYNGIEDATGNKPAPGNPGSAFNEIISGEGIHILNENPNMSEEELAQKMFDEFGNTTLGQEQTQASGIDPPIEYPDEITKNIKDAKQNKKDYEIEKLGDKPSKKKEPKAFKAWEKKRKKLAEKDKEYQKLMKAEKKAEKDKAVYSKCAIAARSAKQKHENSTRRTKNLQEQGKLGEKTETKTFYGADDSKQAQVDVIEESKKKGGKVLLPNGQEVDHDDAIAFIKAGGGGQNPSDTATFVTDEDGNVMIQFHSDKMSTADIQDNSTLAKEGDNYKESIDKQPLNEQQKKEAKAIVDRIDKEIAEIEENYQDQSTPIAKKLETLPIDQQVDIIEKDTKTLKKNMREALRASDGGVKEQYKKYLPEGKTKFDELSTQEQYEIIRKITSDGNAGANDTKVINKVATAVSKANPDEPGLDVKGNLAEQRKKVVNLQRQRVEELNKTKVMIDGVEVPLGDMMEAEEMIRGFHLKQMDDNKYDKDGTDDEKFAGIMDSAFDTNMGGVVVTGETLKKCTGQKSTKDMKKNFKLEEPEGKNKDGRDARFTYDSNGNITGKKVFVYTTDDKGNKIEIGFKTYRSKQGSDGKTSNTMQYSKAMQKCFKTGKKQ